MLGKHYGGAVVGSLMAYHIISSGYNWILYLVFSGVMYMAMALVIRPKQHVMTALPISIRDSYIITGSYLDQALKVYVNYGVRRDNLIKAWGGVMLFGGLISGLLGGIGGGPINMLALYWAAELPIKVASATSNLLVGVTAATSGTLYWFFGYIQPFMAMASVIGIVIGANISTHILPRARGGSTIKALLLSIFSYLAYRMLLSGLRRGGILMLPINLEYTTSLMVLVITLGILFALRKHISE